MKKLFSILIILTMSFVNLNASNDTLTKTQIYNDFKSLYKDDVKGSATYVVEKGENVVRYAADKADSLLTKTFRNAGHAAGYTFDVLKKQQLVKSIHHLFYWVISIICSIVLYFKIKAYVLSPNERSLTFILIFSIVDILLFLYNGLNFNEMLTGFFNADFGAMKDLILYSKSVRY